MEKRSEDDRPSSALSSETRPGSEACSDWSLSGACASETHGRRECARERARRCVQLRRLPTEPVVLQRELSSAHEGRHRDLPAGQLAQVLLALLLQLGVQRCVSAGRGDHLTGRTALIRSTQTPARRTAWKFSPLTFCSPLSRPETAGGQLCPFHWPLCLSSFLYSPSPLSSSSSQSAVSSLRLRCLSLQGPPVPSAPPRPWSRGCGGTEKRDRDVARALRSRRCCM